MNTNVTKAVSHRLSLGEVLFTMSSQQEAIRYDANLVEQERKFACSAEINGASALPLHSYLRDSNGYAMKKRLECEVEMPVNRGDSWIGNFVCY
jgi:hypothetical protein